MLKRLFFHKDQSVGFRDYRFVFFAIAAVAIAGAFVFFYKPTTTNIESESRMVLEPDAEDPFLGEKNAPITVIAVSDPLCPGGKTFFDTVEADLQMQYIERGLVKFYHWPMIISEDSVPALEAMYCANDQGKYWEYRNVMLSVPREFGTWATFETADYQEFARKIDLDMKDFVFCFDSKKHEERIRQKDAQRAAANINVSTTAFINKQRLEFVLKEDMFVAIERILMDKNLY